MIEEESPPYLGTRMYLHPGEEATEMGKATTEKAEFMLPEKMS
jgi:hypothetical protein